jgi:hypothetical protein
MRGLWAGSLNLTGLRRRLFYKPLAILMSILLMPVFSWMEGGGAGRRALQASAQTIESCSTPRGNKIIQKVCVNGVPYGPDLNQLEADAVSLYLKERGLPETDANLIYSLGRTDLRSAIRGEMLGILLGIINTPASARSDHEKRLYAWFEGLVKQNEIAEYTLALEEYRRFQADPCNFTLDPDIAQQYGLSYNGPALCAPATVIAAGPPWVPAASYFTAFGIKNSYGKSAKDHPNFANLVLQTQINLGLMYGIAVGLGAVVATATAIPIYAFFATLFPFAGKGVAAAGVAGGIGALKFTVVAGPAAIVFVCVMMAVAASFQLANNQQQIAELNNLSNLLSQAQNSPPDLLAFASDSNPLGLFKLSSTLVSQTVPDVPSTAALPAHQPVDPVFVITPRGGNPKASDSFSYDNWNQVAWQAETSGGWFKQTCLGDSSGKNCPQEDSFIASVQYVDWSGVKRTASRFGSNFAITKGEPAKSDKKCEADTQTGVTPGTDFSQCVSYVASEIQYTYQGNAYSMRLSHPPVFTSEKTISFTWQGPQQHAAVTAAGIPAPDISLANGSSLPAGVTFSRGNGTAQFSFAGSSSGTRGTYHVNLQAQNADGSITQDVTIVIASQLAITSPRLLNVDYGQPVSFLVTTTGELPMKLSISPELLFSGLNFHDNGNGTATITGSTTAGANKGTVPYCTTVNGVTICTGITATNAQGSVTQAFSTRIKAPPDPQITLPAALFLAGIPNSVIVTTTGATTPVAFVFGPGDMSWLNFHDNGDGTGVLSGTPPPGTAGSFTAYLYAIAKVSGLLCCPPNSPFTINVLGRPLFLSPNMAQFSVGDFSSFTISTNQPSGSISEIGDIPQGLEFTDNGNGTAIISGFPAADTGGIRTLQLSIAGATGTGTQELTLLVNEAPRFTTPTWVNFYAGQENSFAVVVSGYPSLSSAPISQSQTAPAFVPGTEFTVLGLPADLSYSNLNPEGFNTGTLTLSGTPSSSDVGKRVITISASNGVGAPVTQTLTLHIAAVLGDVNGDGVVNCTDLDLVKASLNKYRGEVGYNAAADINNDGVVNVEDLALVARHIPSRTVCR